MKTLLIAARSSFGAMTAAARVALVFNLCFRTAIVLLLSGILWVEIQELRRSPTQLGDFSSSLSAEKNKALLFKRQMVVVQGSVTATVDRVGSCDCKRY